MGVYGPALVVTNLILLITSTILIFLGSVLVHFYHLPTISFVNALFSVVPNLMVGVGVVLLVVSMLGLAVVGMQSKVALIVYAVLMAFTCVLQVASVFTTAELRSHVREKVLDVAVRNDKLKSYYTDDAFRSDWDTLQRDYSCCGDISDTGYQIWQNIDDSSRYGSSSSSDNKGVPDSCCYKESVNCGANIFDMQQLDVYRQIHTYGCLTMLNTRFERDLIPMLVGYMVVGVLLALLQLLGLAMAASYAAAIRRRDRPAASNYKGSRNVYEDNNPRDPLYNEKIYSLAGTMDSGVAGSASGSLRPSRPTSRAGSLKGDLELEKKGDNFRSSLYVEPSDEEGTQI